MVTDERSVCSYIGDMTRKPIYRTEPAGEMNQWVRDALEHAGMSQSALSDLLTRQRTLGHFDKSKVQKMTVARKVSMDEARAISEITGFPLPLSSDARELVTKMESLNGPDREILNSLIDSLLKRQDGEQSS